MTFDDRLRDILTQFRFEIHKHRFQGESVGETGMDWSPAARQFSQQEPGTLIDLLTEGKHGKYALTLALVLKEKQFKWLQKKAIAGTARVRVHFDALEHPETGVVIVYILVEVEGLKKTFRGFMDILDYVQHGMLAGLEKAATSGVVDLMFVSPPAAGHIGFGGKHFFLKMAGDYDYSDMEGTILSAIDTFQDDPWSDDDFLQSFSDIDAALESLGIKTIDDYIEARQQAELEEVD